MRVLARFYGLVGMNLHLPPGSGVTFDLPEGATYRTLLDQIGVRYGHLFPPGVWLSENRTFRRGIETIVRGQGLMECDNTPLVDGMELYFLVPFAGG